MMRCSGEVNRMNLGVCAILGERMRWPRRARFTVAVGLALACAAALAGSAPALAAGCENEKGESNEAVRSEANSTLLPQCRVYEMVSPVYTDGGGAPVFFGAAPDGEAAEFYSPGGFAGIQSDNVFNLYIARRGGEGWNTSSVGLPGTLRGARLGWTTSFDLTKQLARVQYLTGEKAGLAGLFFSSDLVAAPALSWVELPQYIEILPHEPGSPGIGGPVDESPDFSHVVFEGPRLKGYDREQYELAGVGGPAPVLTTVNVDPNGNTIRSVTRIGGAGVRILPHAVSNDGAEVFFTEEATGVSYVRVNGETASPTTLELGGLFRGASEDGSKAFVSGAGGGLYMDVIDSEPGHVAVTRKVAVAPAGQTNTYLRSGDDGSHVYFTSTGVLAKNKNENKEKAEPRKENLYVYDTVTEKAEKTAFIAQALPGVVNGGSEAQVNGCPSRELGEAKEPGCEGGRFFVFATTAKITPDDTSSAQQVFEYDAKSGRLVRVSTGEDGYAGNGNGNALGASIRIPDSEGEEESQLELFEGNTRALSDDGSTVVFSSSGALSPRAVNDLQQQPGPLDVYEWHEGQVSLISTGHSLTSDERPAITPSGRDIFFTTTENLLPQDSDGLAGLYDARIDGGFPAASVPAGGCNGDACQGPPSVPELLGVGASATFSGLGNPAPVVSKPAVKCKKGYMRKKGRCVRKAKARKAGDGRRTRR
jgi:hypothetical protein